MERDNLFNHAHAHFYEPIGAKELTPEYVDKLTSLLPEGWSTHRWDVWVGANPDGGERGPVQGFKIHLSCTPRHAERLLELAVPELVRRRIGFKIAGDPWMHATLISKRYGRGGAGKFMTIYPPGDEAFKELIEALYQATKDEEVAGPYILSDRRYKDSRVVYYRYGGFQTIPQLRPDGTRRSMVQSPSGELVPDDRTPYFNLPPWVEDPFGGSATLEEPKDPVLKERYRVDSVVVFSNAGGVYRGTDLTDGREVIIKEARPLAHYWNRGGIEVDAIGLLEREFRILQRLDPLGIVPAPIDFFHEWEHAFLVEGFVPGRTFQQFWNHDQNILGPFIRRPGRVEGWAPAFRTVALAVLDAVERIHGRGVLLGDLSPTNVFVELETLRVSFIDFESAFMTDEGPEMAEFSRAWGTLGYVNPELRQASEFLTPADDLYGVGMLLYSAVVPVQNLFALYAESRDHFLDRFVRLGVPVQVKEVILALMEGRAGRAREILEAWQPAAPEPVPAAAEEPAAEPAYA